MLLSNSFAGEAGLAANFTRHGGDPDRRTSAADASAVRRSAAAGAQDPFIAGGNIADLADGLGTTLGSSYLAVTESNSAPFTP